MARPQWGTSPSPGTERPADTLAAMFMRADQDRYARERAARAGRRGA